MSKSSKRARDAKRAARRAALEPLIRESPVAYVRLGGYGPYVAYRRGELGVLSWDAFVGLCGGYQGAISVVNQWP